jgi:primary-amine oxidase
MGEISMVRFFFALQCFILALALIASPEALAAKKKKKPPANPPAVVEQAPPAIPHPLDALSPAEIEATSRLLKTNGTAGDKTLFGIIALDEPAKADVLAWQPGKEFQRHAFVILRKDKKTFEARVDIKAGKVLSVTEKPGAFPMIMNADWGRGRDAFMKDPRFAEALKKRGITDVKTVFCTPNSAGYFPGEAGAGRFLLKVPCFSSAEKLHPTLARPIEGLMGVVDAETGDVISVLDRETVPLPPAPQGYGDTLPKQDAPSAPAEILVAAPGNIKLSGQVMVDWLNWNFHVRADKRAGLIISLARFKDKDRWRSMAYEMNVSEMFVPYMDPNPTWSYRTFMDVGEFGLGYLTSTLAPGIDCPANAYYIDLTFPNDIGGSYVKQRALCIFERPTGDPAWRHYSSGRNLVIGEPKLELVVRTIPTLGNYDYVVDYVFDASGTIKLRVGATGFDAIKSTAAADMDALSAKDDTAYGSLIAPYTVAPNHDHYFSFRLDMDVDAPQNTFVRDAFVPQAAKDAGGRTSLWTTKTQRFLKEGPIAGDHETMANGVSYRLQNGNEKNTLKQTPSLWFNAHHDATSILDAADPPQARATFTKNQFWISKYKPDEQWSAGTYPNLSQKDEGLPAYVADGEDVTNEDIVVWYTMGFRHVTRPEDFPILPTFWHEMTIRPAFFFDRDPSMTFNSGHAMPQEQQ